MGFNFYEHMQTVLAFANYCATTLCYMMHNVATNCLATHGNVEFKKRVFTKNCKWWNLNIVLGMRGNASCPMILEWWKI